MYFLFYHVAAMFDSRSTGRYLCAQPALTMTNILQIVHENFSDLSVPTKALPDLVIRIGMVVYIYIRYFELNFK